MLLYIAKYYVGNSWVAINRSLRDSYSEPELRGPEGDAALALALNCDQGVYYKNLSRRRQKDEKFVYGWLKNRVLDQVRGL